VLFRSFNSRPIQDRGSASELMAQLVATLQIALHSNIGCEMHAIFV
jgi:hypothetical protein